MISPLPDYPWQVIGNDLFKLKGVIYLLVVDYFRISRYPEIAKLTSTTLLAMINVPEVHLCQVWDLRDHQK